MTGSLTTPSQDGTGRSGRQPAITLIAAVARNGTIGADGGLPWHLPADLKRFKALTMGHPMIMGRRTFESIGRVLPGRRTIVVTRDPTWSFPGVTVAYTVQDAVAAAQQPEGAPAAASAPSGPEARPTAVMVVGGGEIYRQTIADADRLEITHVDADVAGDTTFPAIDPQLWQATVHEEGDGYRFVTYDRRTGADSTDAASTGPSAAQLDARPRGANQPNAGSGDGAESDTGGADDATPNPGPVRDLSVLLTSMRPHLHDGEYVFCSLPGSAVPDGTHPVATMREEEGLTVVVPAPEALAAGLDSAFRCAWITLEVHSALDAVGLTAAVATALTTDGIACNVIAGAHHDHLFVPYDAAARAMAALEALAHTRA